MAVQAEVLVMSTGDSITCWQSGVKDRNDRDIRRFWDRYFSRLVAAARARRLQNARSGYDEQGLALSAFQSFDRAARGQLPELRDLKRLWRLLAAITVRMAIRSIKHRNRQQRGGANALGESARIVAPEQQTAAALFSRASPELAARFAYDLERRLAELGDPILRKIATRALKGHSSQEIAASLAITAQTVDSKLKLIRDIWRGSLH
jgi:DNA-directed RNA polymerase specialized sigma24 family protein